MNSTEHRIPSLFSIVLFLTAVFGHFGYVRAGQAFDAEKSLVYLTADSVPNCIILSGVGVHASQQEIDSKVCDQYRQEGYDCVSVEETRPCKTGHGTAV